MSSSEEIAKMIGKAFIDDGYRIDLDKNLDAICERMKISGDERKKLDDYLGRVMSFYGSEHTKLPVQNVRRTNSELEKLAIDIQKYAFQVLQDSIQSSRSTFGKITIMSYVIFGTGIFLFVLSALSGLLLEHKEQYSIAFGALGVVSFVAFFIFEPVKNVQRSLSNLLQAEVIFMNFWDQLNFWAPFGDSDDLQKKKEGSNQIQELTKEILGMLEDYIESGDKAFSFATLQRLVGHGGKTGPASNS